MNLANHVLLPAELNAYGKNLRTNGSGAVANRSSLPKRFRWPDKSVGNWVDLLTSDTQIGLQDIQFKPMQPIPEFGFVPIEATAPTLRVTVTNSSHDYVADLRIRAKAMDRSGNILADDTTETPGDYSLIPPKSSKKRTFVFDSLDTAFLNSESWPDFSVSVDLLAARLVSIEQLELVKSELAQ